MQLHDSIRWGLHGGVIRKTYLPRCEQEAGKSKLSKLLIGFAEGVVLLNIVELVKDIELTLKERIENFFLKRNGIDWWNVLPKQIQVNARNRHKWAAAQLGLRRTDSLSQIDWLSMGDVLRVLEDLNNEEWKICLDAETYRRKQFASALSTIKAFRDNYLAHPKPRNMSHYEISNLCRAIQRIPIIIRPNEWNMAVSLINSFNTLPSESKGTLWDLVKEGSHGKNSYLHAWLASDKCDKPILLKNESKISLREIKWREHLITYYLDFYPSCDESWE